MWKQKRASEKKLVCTPGNAQKRPLSPLLWAEPPPIEGEGGIVRGENRRVGWDGSAEPMDPGRKSSKSRVPGERKLLIWAPWGAGGDKGKKCHQLEPRLEGDSFWMRVEPLLKMLSPSPEPADRLCPAFAQQSEGLQGCV